MEEEIKKLSDDIFFQVFPTNELIIMPLKIKNKVIGLIIADNLYTQKHTTDEDLRIFMTLANQAALAIENSQLYEMIKRRSDTDSITGLWNHGFFQYQLSKLLRACQKNRQALSLLILDIDNFKILNDTLGHQHGDIVLKELGFILKDSSRDVDFVCRYGGEEFSVILPQINKDQAQEIAERIRKRVAQHRFSQISSQEPTGITVSIGVSAIDHKVLTKEKLITAADQAMYKAKNSGKNQTCVA